MACGAVECNATTSGAAECGPAECAADGPLAKVNPFMPTVPKFAVRETDVSRHNGGTSGVPLKPIRDDSVLRALLSLRGLRGASEVPPLCRERLVSRTANVGTVGMNGLKMTKFTEKNSATETTRLGE